MLPEENTINAILQPIISPWYESLENPQKTQEQVLDNLVKEYAKTDYGTSHGASGTAGILDYQKNFPIVNYKALLPYFSRVKEGNYKAFLSEPPECWVMTRGSTGTAKVLPATPDTPKTNLHMWRKSTHKLRVANQEIRGFHGRYTELEFPLKRPHHD